MFVEKLNKKQKGTYTVTDEKVIVDGKFEGLLDHDNVENESITVNTLPNFEGSRVDNFFLSTPSDRHWKTSIRVYSSSPKVYITYETQGDQVDAHDVNVLQEQSALNTDNLTEYKTLNNADIKSLKAKDTSLSELKAEKTYVDTELNKKYNKDQVFTKAEVLQKVENLIGTAPDALDTLAELADALNNDPNFAANVTNLLTEKVDKVVGKSLTDENYTNVEKSKLAGVEANANKYTHPASHSATIIVESASKRFVSDAEKGTWDDKETPTNAQTKATKALTDAKGYTDSKVKTDVPVDAKFTDTIVDISNKADKNQVLTNVPANAKFTDTNTITSINGKTGVIAKADIVALGLPSQDTIIDISGKVDKITGKGLSTNDYTSLDKVEVGKVANKADKTYVDSKVKTDVPLGAEFTDTIVDISSKADKSQVLTNVPSGAKFTDTIYSHPTSHPASMITETSLKRFVTDTEKGVWSSKWDYSEATIKAVKVSNATNADTVNGKTVAVNVPAGAKFTDTIVDISGKADKTQIPTKNSQLLNDSNFITQADLGSAGLGDMSKAVYDKNNNGKVDVSENADKLGGLTPDKYMKVAPLTWNNLKGV